MPPRTYAVVRLAVWRGTRTLIPLSAHCRRAAREKPTASSSQKKIQSRQREPGVTWVEPVRAAFPPESWSDRDDHLRSPEFFDAAQFPEIVFESTKIEALDDDDFRITGRLTIHGVSHEIVLDAEVGRHRAPPAVHIGLGSYSSVSTTWPAALQAKRWARSRRRLSGGGPRRPLSAARRARAWRS